MRGIILAAGSGDGLHPLTAAVSKHLLPVYDKPMVYYPLSVLMLAGIREILLISDPEHLPAYARLLADGSALGLDVRYAAQDRPCGPAGALTIGRDFVGGEQVCLILGDNLFHGNDFAELLRRERDRVDGATLFGAPTSGADLTVTGLYLYDNEAVAHAATLGASGRGEPALAALHRHFARQGRARLVDLGRGTAWFDAGTPDSLLDAANFVRVLQERQGIRMACVEEVAHEMGFITDEQFALLVGQIPDPAAGGGPRSADRFARLAGGPGRA